MIPIFVINGIIKNTLNQRLSHHAYQRQARVFTFFVPIINSTFAETPSPFYLWANSAKTQADTFVEEERIMKTLSQEEQAELMAAYEKAFSFFRKYETKIGRSRPDLSYTPQTN